jgi:hypothetical protein
VIPDDNLARAIADDPAYPLQYDRIFQDILPFHALSPATLRQRANVLPATDFTYTLHISSDTVSITGDRATASRPKSLLGMIEGFRHFLPEDFSLDITGSDHDLGSWVLGQDQRDKAVELVKQGRCAYDYDYLRFGKGD